MSNLHFILISSDEENNTRPPKKKKQHSAINSPRYGSPNVKSSGSSAAKKGSRSQSRRNHSQEEGEDENLEHRVAGVHETTPDLSMLAAGQSHKKSKSPQIEGATSTASAIQKATNKANTVSQTLNVAQHSPLSIRTPALLEGRLSPRPHMATEVLRGESPDTSESEASSVSHTMPTVKEVFESCSSEMTQDHAFMVRDLLREARTSRNELQKSLPDFRTDVSPFAGMKDISSSASDNQPTLEVKHLMAKKSQQVKSIIPLKVNKTSTIPIPKYDHYIEIDRNFLVPDVTQAGFIPYIGDEDDEEEWHHIFCQSYDVKSAQRNRIADAELVFTLQDYFPSMLKKLKLSADDVHQAVNGKGGLSAADEFCTSFQKYFGINPELLLSTKDHNNSTQNGKPLFEWQKRIENDPSEKMLSSYLSEFCLICGQSTCGIHGDHRVPINGGEDKAGAPIAYIYHNAQMSYEDIMRRRNERLARERAPARRVDSKQEYCSSECFKKSLNGADKSPSTTKWTEDKTIRLSNFLLALPNHPRAACVISNFFDESCRKIYAQIQTLPPPSQPVSIIIKERRSLPWYDKQTKRISAISSLDLDKVTNTHRHSDADDSGAGRDTPFPCHHPERSCDEAGDDCSCKKENVLCERWCECPDDCYLRFQGCSCAQTQRPCQTKAACACFDLNRECDPALCKSCGAVESADPENRDCELPLTLCLNTAMQRGARKATRIGESTIPGEYRINGLFMCEPAKKGDFIDEYVGEIISNAEMERRECIATKKGASYVFGLNAQFNIDSVRYGNNLRHVNHSRDNLNIEPRVSLVDMSHRIGFYASRNLKAGEELFFDYGKHFDAKINGLAELRKIETKIRKRRTKQEILDALENGSKVARKSAVAPPSTTTIVDVNGDHEMLDVAEEPDGSEFEDTEASAERRRQKSSLAAARRKAAAKVKKYTR